MEIGIFMLLKILFLILNMELKFVGSKEKNDKYPVKNIIVKNNELNDNTITGLRNGEFDEEDTGIVKDCEIVENVISGSHTAIIISKAENIVFDGNQFLDNDKYLLIWNLVLLILKILKLKIMFFLDLGNLGYMEVQNCLLMNFLKKYPSNSKK